MKKILTVFFLITICLPGFAVNFGSYKTETDYGLIDGFKWNFFDKDKKEPFVQLKSETPEEIKRLEKEKNKPKEELDEVQMYKFMLENINTF